MHSLSFLMICVSHYTLPGFLFDSKEKVSVTLVVFFYFPLLISPQHQLVKFQLPYQRPRFVYIRAAEFFLPPWHLQPEHINPHVFLFLLKHKLRTHDLSRLMKRIKVALICVSAHQTSSSSSPMGLTLDKQKQNTRTHTLAFISLSYTHAHENKRFRVECLRIFSRRLAKCWLKKREGLF